MTNAIIKRCIGVLDDIYPNLSFWQENGEIVGGKPLPGCYPRRMDDEEVIDTLVERREELQQHIDRIDKLLVRLQQDKEGT